MALDVSYVATCGVYIGLTIEGLGARTAQLKDLQYWENAKENMSVPITFSGKNSTTRNDRADKRGQE